MPKRPNTKIRGSAQREDVTRKNPKAIHPLLTARSDGSPSRHREIWQLIVQEGNHRGGMTAAQIEQLSPSYHPQIIKDLIDHRLITALFKNDNNENLYIADAKGRGTYVQEVTVEVELLEDADGKFVTKTTLIGRQGNVGRIIRSLGKRRVHFTIPLPDEAGVETVAGGVVNVDSPEGFSRVQGAGAGQVIEGEAQVIRDTGLIEASYTILDG